MSNLKDAPISLTPQITRGLLGIGHPKRVKTVPVRRGIKLVDAPSTSKLKGHL